MISTAEAQQLLRQGRLAEAQRAYESILEQMPDNVEALNAVALGELRGGRVQRAVELLEHAARVNPQDALTQHHLGRAHEAAGNSLAALQAEQRAVQLQPDFFVARLHLGILLERAGERHRALLHYARTLRDAQAKGRWINPQSTSPALQPLVEHAVRTFRDGRRKILFDLLDPLVQRYGRDSLQRVERCIRVYLNEEPPAYPDARQQPTFLYMPGLPTSPYIDLAACSWIAGLQEQTSVICAELQLLLPSQEGRERVFTSDELEQAHLRGLQQAPSWTGYYFYRHGERRTQNCESCPRTAQALDALPLARVSEHAPEAFFSVFTPGTHLLPHRGVTNTRVVGHLPLIVPADCALSVGGEVHAWQEGRVVVFDDTYEHEAWNRSDNVRVILIFDVWNPWLTDVERLAVADLVAAIGGLRKSMDAV